VPGVRLLLPHALSIDVMLPRLLLLSPKAFQVTLRAMASQTRFKIRLSFALSLCGNKGGNAPCEGGDPPQWNRW
jgi:hypothetical protein